jgi:hypothetical protein
MKPTRGACMRMARLIAALCGFAAVGAPLGALAGTHPACQAPELGTARAALVSPPLVYVVTGPGRLPFYSAPDARCVLSGVFVIAKDELVVYGLTDDGWASVAYFKGTQPTGWVRSARLKSTGTAVGPNN